MTVHLQLQDQEDWDTRSVVEQKKILDDAFDLAKQKKASVVGKNNLVTFRKENMQTDPKTDDTQTLTPEEKISKAAVDFMKRALGMADADNDLFNMGLDAYKKANPGKGINAFIVTNEGSSLADRVAKSRSTLMLGPVEGYTKPLDEEFDKLEGEIGKSVESFAVAHNLDPRDARRRLEALSPTFAALVKRQNAIPAEKREQLAKCATFATRWREGQVEAAKKAAEADVAKQMEERNSKLMTPSERKFAERVGEIMKERKIERPAATNWAIQNDPIAKALYAVTRDERASIGARP